jgi:hypothetical protein
VCHDDLAGLAEDQVAGTGEFGQPSPYRRDIERQPFGEVVCTWRAPGARERAVDGQDRLVMACAPRGGGVTYRRVHQASMITSWAMPVSTV